MTPEKLRAAAEAVLSPSGNYRVYPDSLEVTCARAALALAELMPVIDEAVAAADNWDNGPDAGMGSAEGRMIRAQKALDAAWTKAKESLQ